MSDTTPFDSILKWKLGIESPSLAYAAKTVTRNIILAEDVPYPLLKLWHDFIKTKMMENNTYYKEEPSCSTLSNLLMHESNMKLSYVDLFDYSVPGNAFAISSDEKIRLEVNESLRKKFVEKYKVNMQRPQEQGGKRNSTQKTRYFIYLKDKLSQCRNFTKR